MYDAGLQIGVETENDLQQKRRNDIYSHEAQRTRVIAWELRTPELVHVQLSERVQASRFNFSSDPAFFLSYF